MNTHPLSGVYAAAVTPLLPNGEIDHEGLFPLLEFLESRGCHGALIFGTTGEGPSFSEADRIALMQTAVKYKLSHPNFRLLAGTGTPSLSESIALTKSGFDLGFDGVVTLPPYYFRKATDDGLFNYFSALIKAAVPADKYMLGYHIPGMAGVGFSIELLKRLKDAFPKQFAGIKDSSHDEALISQLGNTFGADLLILNGTDSYLQNAMNAHAGGCITAPANLISPELRQLYNAYLAGEDTNALQERITHLRHVLEKYQPFPPILKALLAKMHNLPRWSVHPPLEDVKDEVVEMAMEEMSNE